MFTKFKRTWSLAPDFQIVQKFPENITLAYIYQLVKFRDLISLVQDILKNASCPMH